jgi:hypothetical protein
MSWQAFSWHEIMDQARESQIAERLQPAIDWTGIVSRDFLELLGAFLTPLALTAGALGSWRWAADLGWTGDFFITSGILSHWQVWFALAAATQAASVALNRWLKNSPNPLKTADK